MKQNLYSFLTYILLCVSICISCSNNPISTKNVDSNSSLYTELSGGISGILHKDQSPYFAIDSLYIEKGKTLTIEPGVIIFFSDTAQFLIQGNIIAIGNKDQTILFSSYSKNWEGMFFKSSCDTSKLIFCIFENVKNIYNNERNESCITIYQSNLLIRNCIIQNCYSDAGGGLFAYLAEVNLKNTILRNNRSISYGGAALLYKCKSTIINNTFYNNTCINSGGGIVLFQPDTTNIQNNIFYLNTSKADDPNFSVDQYQKSIVYEAYNYFAKQYMDPQFISEDDLHLNTNSPCIDKGNPADIFNDLNGTTNDQGAYGGPSGNW